MPRTARRDTDGKYFHIMVQGIGKEFIFPTDEFKGYYLASLKKAIEKTHTKILAFCVMSNHAHILLVVENAQELAAFMNFANAEYARYYNSMKRRVGYVFRDRYKSQNIKNINHLISCLAYIHNNPLKAKMVMDAENYKYSSYKNYLEQIGIVDFEEASTYYDITPGNIRAIMKEKTSLTWLEHDDKDYEAPEKVLHEILRRRKISLDDLPANKKLLKEVAQEILERSAASQRKIASLLKINREFLRRAFVSIPPSP